MGLAEPQAAVDSRRSARSAGPEDAIPKSLQNCAFAETIGTDEVVKSRGGSSAIVWVLCGTS